MSVTDEAGMLERGDELRLIDDALSSARDGRGRLVIVEGEPGIGKSRLLADAGERAGGAGMRVMTVAGLELERDFPFGLALRLVERATHGLDAPDRKEFFAGPARAVAELLAGRVHSGGGRGADRGYALVHGLRALVLKMAAGSGEGLAVVVDDAQWADGPSLRFLVHLASDLRVHPVALVVAARLGTPSAPPELTEALARTPGAQVVRLRPLSAQGVEQLVRGVYPDAPTELWRACARTTGGNPFYLHELLELAVANGLSSDGHVEIEALVPESVMHAVLVRLARLAEPAPALAAAASVLGDEVPLRLAAALAGLGEDEAEAVADTLAAARILRPGDPLSFTHPLIGAAVHADLPALARSRAHRRAADLLRCDGSAVEAVAAHLALCRAQGDPQVVDILCEAAQHAADRGGHREARRLLQRALDEPPRPAQHPKVAVGLALAEGALGTPDALGRLRHALELVEDPRQRVATLRALARVQFARSDFDAAALAVDQALSEVGEDDCAASDLLVESLVVSSVGGASSYRATSLMIDLLRDVDEGRLPADPRLVAEVCGAMLAAGRPAEEVSRVARAALAGLPSDDGFFGVVTGG
ncbi:MAG: AAA family ATPase, partial [Acidimicrobiales bacterium]